MAVQSHQDQLYFEKDEKLKEILHHKQLFHSKRFSASGIRNLNLNNLSNTNRLMQSSRISRNRSSMQMQQQLTNSSIKIRDLVQNKPIQLEPQSTPFLNQDPDINRIVKAEEFTKLQRVMLFHRVKNCMGQADQHLQQQRQQISSNNNSSETVTFSTKHLTKELTQLKNYNQNVHSLVKNENGAIGTIFLSHALPSREQIVHRYLQKQSNTFYFEFQIVSTQQTKEKISSDKQDEQKDFDNSQNTSSNYLKMIEKNLLYNKSLLETDKQSKVVQNERKLQKQMLQQITDKSAQLYQDTQSQCFCRFGLASLNFQYDLKSNRGTHKFISQSQSQPSNQQNADHVLGDKQIDIEQLRGYQSILLGEDPHRQANKFGEIIYQQKFKYKFDQNLKFNPNLNNNQSQYIQKQIKKWLYINKPIQLNYCLKYLKNYFINQQDHKKRQTFYKQQKDDQTLVQPQRLIYGNIQQWEEYRIIEYSRLIV
eukprot:403360795